MPKCFLPLGMPARGTVFTAALQASRGEAIMRSYFPHEDVFYSLTFWMLEIHPLPHFVAHNFLRCCQVSSFLAIAVKWELLGKDF